MVCHRTRFDLFLKLRLSRLDSIILESSHFLESFIFWQLWHCIIYLFIAIGFVPFLTDILSRAVPVLPHVKVDILRHAWAHALRAFCESVREYVSMSAMARNGEGQSNECMFSDPEMLQQNYADQLELAYDAVYNWMSAKDVKVDSTAVSLRTFTASKKDNSILYQSANFFFVSAVFTVFSIKLFVW